MAKERILITGGAGKVATLLRPLLARPGRTLRLLDVRQPEPTTEPADGGEEVVVASVDDLDAMVEACRDVDAIVHLGGQSREAGVEEVLRLNAYGTYCVLEAARRTGVKRVVLASSNHAAGFHQRQGAPAGGLPADAPGRPDTLYGWSKVAAEAAGQLYADRFGMDVVCLRIGLWFPRPPGLRGLALWLSPDDGARLVEACLTADSPGFRIVWGISRNTRRWWSLAEGEAIGYHPKDDAEKYADELVAAHGEPDFDADPVLDRVGGQWCDVPLGERY
ncbi:NAD(P)-dependent oxidoreductase [Micromonospora sp. C31]|uniref:NAD-dependent epimerase/dehydratase family protein n=1 Tax=Micromonospora sp. C31 TaxID=2824876 RepID=UPI001B372193|nr:NAD(P)-dependent oxidoreductase [Micromonospora sp. C31]MBQ1073314.1 NAD(P)-dependent oxidoreductase [Micromonospora sp. C31]